jgi:hypothetical protein
MIKLIYILLLIPAFVFSQTKAKTYVNAKFFGVVADGTDKTVQLQRAIDYARDKGINKVILPAGRIRIDKGVLVAPKDRTVFLEGFEITGENVTYGDGPGQTSIIVGKDAFGIAFQRCKGYKVANIYFEGQNPLWRLTWSQMINDSTDWFNGCRSDRLSPHAGVVVDPFYSANETYPGWEHDWSQNGSTGGYIENCIFRYFVVAIAIKPCGSTGNGELIKINDCSINYCTYGVSTGDHQTRSIFINNMTCWGGVNTLFTGYHFGNYCGVPVEVDGLNVAGGVKYLTAYPYFHNSNGFSFTRVHAETLWSLTDPSIYGSRIVIDKSFIDFDAVDGVYNPKVFTGVELIATGTIFTYYAGTDSIPEMEFYGENILFIGCRVDKVKMNRFVTFIKSLLEGKFYDNYKSQEFN